MRTRTGSAIEPAASLRDANTLQLECQPRSIEVIDSVERLRRLCELVDASELLILGEGSNVVLAPRIERRVCLMRTRGIQAKDCGRHVEVTVAAGENWHDLVRWSLGAGLCGLENLILIPGSVGAAPVQNIGAYGLELSDRCTKVQVADLTTGEVGVLQAEGCGFGYRTSIFKAHPGRYAITGVTLALPREADLRLDYPDVLEELDRMGISKVRPLDVAEAVVRVRRRKLPDPRRVANVGSFFKNPVVSPQRWRELQQANPQLRAIALPGDSAGRSSRRSATQFKLSAAQLIDLAGWKQRPAGALRVWNRQPLVLTNGDPGGRAATADGAQVMAYAARIQRDIASRFGVRLEIEPDTIGFQSRTLAVTHR